jgi:hypothetical protein
MLDTQSSEDLAPLLQRGLVLRGTVRAEGWAEADKAEAQRNPGAKREHRIILGHAPSQDDIVAIWIIIPVTG